MSQCTSSQCHIKFGEDGHCSRSDHNPRIKVPSYYKNPCQLCGVRFCSLECENSFYFIQQRKKSEKYCNKIKQINNTLIYWGRTLENYEEIIMTYPGVVSICTEECLEDDLPYIPGLQVMSDAKCLSCQSNHYSKIVKDFIESLRSVVFQGRVLHLKINFIKEKYAELFDWHEYLFKRRVSSGHL